MVLQVAPHPWQVAPDGDPHLLQVLLGPKAGDHEQLGGSYGAAAQDGLLTGEIAESLAKAEDLKQGEGKNKWV